MKEQAKTTLEGAIRRFSGKAAFELELALLLLKEDEAGGVGARSRAEQLLNSAITHDSTLAEAHYQLGDLALRRGQTAQALAHLEKAAKLAPNSARTHFALARTYRRVGRSEDAAKETDLYDKLVDKESQRAVPSPAAPSSR
jgi:Flp pilus assembly protein TadD